MYTNRPFIQDASLTNSINSKAFKIANDGELIDRGVILSNYTQETIDRVWAAFSRQVLQNYLRGKGTDVKGFGVFTYKAPKYSLKFTTNSNQRDQKPRDPVFLVSSELFDGAKKAEVQGGGLRYFSQSECSQISHVKVNYAEIAYSLSLSKDETKNVLQHCFNLLGEAAQNRTLRNKTMPGLGVILCSGSLLGVCFLSSFGEGKKVELRRKLKENISLSSDLSRSHLVCAGALRRPREDAEKLKAKFALTSVVGSESAWRVKGVPEHERKEVYREYEENKGEVKFLNDEEKEKRKKVCTNCSSPKYREKDNNNNNIKIKKEFDDFSLYFPERKLFEFFKGKIINECKKFDINKNGYILYSEFLYALEESFKNEEEEKKKKIVEFFKKKKNIENNNIEYMKMIASIVKEGRAKDNNTKNTINNENNTNSISPNPNISPTIPATISSNSALNSPNLSKRIATLTSFLSSFFFSFPTQKMSLFSFRRLLCENGLEISEEELEKILDFLGIEEKSAFSVFDVKKKIRECKIVGLKDEEEIKKVIKKLKDVIFVNGGKKFLFGDNNKNNINKNNNINNNNNSIDKENFVRLFLDKTNFSYELLCSTFDYLVKSHRNFTYQDYMRYFPPSSSSFSEPFLLSMLKKLASVVSARELRADEFFDFLVGKNRSTKDKVLTRENWIKYLQDENIGYGAEELASLFSFIDSKKDNIIDRAEFCGKFEYANQPLVYIQDIVNRYKLDIEDLAHRMKIDIKEEKEYNLEEFKSKIKLLDYTLPDNFIQNIYEYLKNKEGFVSSKKLLDALNYEKPAETYKSFTGKYMQTLKEKICFEELKKAFEYYDVNSMGSITKLEYVKSVEKYMKQYNDIDHMRFIRVNNMVNKRGYVKYPELLNLVYFLSSSLISDPFIYLCIILQNELKKNCQGDIELLMYKISSGIPKRKSSLNKHKPLTFDEIKNFIGNNNNKINIKSIMKLDIDADGKISYEDLYAVLKRFEVTSFFKYNNNIKDPNINLYSKEKMSDNRFKNIVKSIKEYMKEKNITEIGLFKKFDKDNNGFFSNIDFNITINDILPLSPAIKDQFFNYLDFYHNGLIDIETFIYRLKDYSSNEVIIENNNSSENNILDRFREYILKNNTLSDNEIFSIIDKDCNGLINIEDFKKFTIKDLGISEIEFNDRKLERVMMSLSLSKNLQIGLNDIREFINITNQNKGHMNLKEVFKLTSNQNLNEFKKNKEWTNDIIERFGMYISEKYESIDDFFNENTEKGSDKFKYEDFIRFHEKNYELFNNGFNLTKDELLSIYTSLDSHKKNYLTLTDLKNKLHIFNFYNKMHIDIKNFIIQNFRNGYDAFKFFIKAKNDIQKNNTDNNIKKCYITLKEFFDAFENFFPGKYSTNTILKYINKYFKIDISNKNNIYRLRNNGEKNSISFSEFNYIYFDNIKSNEEFIKNKHLPTKLATNRDEISNKMKNELLSSKTQSNLYYSTLNGKKFEMLQTPFDIDPLNKIKRILCSSKYDLNRFFETAALLCGNNSYIVNKFQFRNIIKELDIGITNLEIEQILMKSGKLTYDGMINLRDFIRYLYSLNPTLVEGQKNSASIVAEIKSLIYKYYSNPVICFQNNDKEHSGVIDFERFREIIGDIYNRDSKIPPNFGLLKNCFDKLDLRKDGVVDLNEWNRAFGYYNGKLDVYKGDKNPVSNEQEFYDNMYKESNNFHNKSISQHNRKILRDWETSGDVSNLYKSINKNRKIIKQKLEDKNYIIDSDGHKLIQANNFINVLKEILPNVNLSPTQWKMIVNVAKTDTAESLINLNEFFRLMEITSKNMISHPKIKTKKYSNVYYNYNPIFDPLNNTNGVGYKTVNNGFYYNRRSNSINREKFRGLSSLEYNNNNNSWKLPYTGTHYNSNLNKSSSVRTQREPLAY